MNIKSVSIKDYLKKGLLFTIVSLALLMLSSAIYVKSADAQQNVSQKPQKAEMTYDINKIAEPVTAYIKDEVYKVILSNGEIIAVPSSSPNEYIVLSGIDVRTLREADLRQLEQGITIIGDDELAAFIEDFTS